MAAGKMTSLPNVSLHSAHAELRHQSAPTLVPLPARFLPEHPLACRKTALHDLLKKLVSAEVQTTSERETLGNQVYLGNMSLQVEKDGGGFLEIPLLFSDIVEAEAGLRHGAGYLVAVAPRPVKAAGEGGSKRASETWSPPLKDVWVLFVNGTHLDLKQLFFEMGSRGALRWDLKGCYRVIPKQLGEGGCGVVVLGQSIIAEKLKITNSIPETSRQEMLSTSQVAIKALKPHETQEGEDLMRTECGFLARARGHPNLTTMFGVFCDHVQREEGRTDKQEASDRKKRHQVATVQWYIVMELCNSGDLFDHLGHHGPLDSNECAELMEGLFSALQHLHKLRIVHRDVKPENILLGSNSRPILADMGISANLDGNGTVVGKQGSPGYAAPEVLLGEAYNQSVDIFSAGCTYYYALTRRQPFEADTVYGTLTRTIQCQVKYPMNKFHQVSRALVQLIKSCISKSPSRRPDACDSLRSVLDWRTRKLSSRSGHQQAEAPAPEPSLTSGASPAAAKRMPPSSTQESSAAPSPVSQCVPPALTPTPPISSHRKPTRLPSRVPAGSAAPAHPAERQEVAGRPARPASAEERQESDARAVAPEGVQELFVTPARTGDETVPRSSTNAAENKGKQERLEKPAMEPEEARELAVMPAAGAEAGAGEGAGGGQQGKLRGGDRHSSRGRKSLSVPVKRLRRIAGAIKDTFFPSVGQHSRSSASAVSSADFSPINSLPAPCVEPESQGSLVHTPAPPQSAPPAVQRPRRSLNPRS